MTRRLNSPRIPHRSETAGRARHAIGMMAGYVIASACLALLGSSVTGQAEVWEFDKKGKVLVAPVAPQTTPDNKAYVTKTINASFSTRNLSASATGNTTGYAAIYRPMAEGVAEVFARDPAVARAGLGAEEFARLFVALIDQESRFNPGAVSPKGARGLGQLMPETAAALGVRDALEPMENLRGAARYLTTQLAAFGRVDLALAAYNAGPGRVIEYQGIPPFRETRDYVARITRAAALVQASEATSPPEAELVSELAPVLNTTIPSKGTVLEWQN